MAHIAEVQTDAAMTSPPQLRVTRVRRDTGTLARANTRTCRRRHAKGLRDRNSPTCTLSQNGYGARTGSPVNHDYKKHWAPTPAAKRDMELGAHEMELRAHEMALSAQELALNAHEIGLSAQELALNARHALAEQLAFATPFAI